MAQIIDRNQVQELLKEQRAQAVAALISASRRLVERAFNILGGRKMPTSWQYFVMIAAHHFPYIALTAPRSRRIAL